jgi:predicted DNA-binding protein (MmcQ/YjbR family)
MNIEEFRDFCLSKTGAEESFPFDEDTLVFKVGSKIFALCSLSRIPTSINLKCDPEYALELREHFGGIVNPGYHMNKKHWNTILLEGALTMELYTSLIDHSYDLVKNSLPKKVKLALQDLETHE